MQAPRPVIERHNMTPGEEAAAWAELRAWVTWLYDRYELSVEDRLPRCWARHPGLIEELAALKAWRHEIYGSGQPSGQAARYWHAELRQVLHAAVTQYALGCRTGHRGAANVRLADQDPASLQEWAAAYPLAYVPGIDLAAGRARRAARPGKRPRRSPRRSDQRKRCAAAARQHRPPDVGQRTWWAPALGWLECRISRPGKGWPSLQPGSTPGTLACRWRDR